MKAQMKAETKTPAGAVKAEAWRARLDAFLKAGATDVTLAPGATAAIRNGTGSAHTQAVTAHDLRALLDVSFGEVIADRLWNGLQQSASCKWNGMKLSACHLPVSHAAMVVVRLN